jgi:hypothetical protein
MANPARQKGTGGETELLRLLASLGVEVHRMPAASRWDLDRGNKPEGHSVLATRPDRGRWLVTMTVEAWADLVKVADRYYSLDDGIAEGTLPLHIEVKRRKTLAHHTLFEQEVDG